MKMSILHKRPSENLVFNFQTAFCLFKFKPIKGFYFFIASVKALTL